MKVYSALNVLGWVVVMPVLVVAAMSPFVNFDGWSGVSGDEARAAQVALLPPRLSEHGSLPSLTEAPRPSAAVPVHRTIAASFTPAPAPARSDGAAAPRRSAGGRRHGLAGEKGSRPRAGARRPTGLDGSRTPVSRRAAPAGAPARPVVPAPSAPQRQPEPTARPERPKPPQQPSQPEPNPQEKPKPQPQPAQQPQQQHVRSESPGNGGGKPEQDGRGNGHGHGRG